MERSGPAWPEAEANSGPRPLGADPHHQALAPPQAQGGPRGLLAAVEPAQGLDQRIGAFHLAVLLALLERDPGGQGAGPAHLGLGVAAVDAHGRRGEDLGADDLLQLVAVGPDLQVEAVPEAVQGGAVAAVQGAARGVVAPPDILGQGLGGPDHGGAGAQVAAQARPHGGGEVVAGLASRVRGAHHRHVLDADPGGEAHRPEVEAGGPHLFFEGLLARRGAIPRAAGRRILSDRNAGRQKQKSGEAGSDCESHLLSPRRSFQAMEATESARSGGAMIRQSDLWLTAVAALAVLLTLGAPLAFGGSVAWAETGLRILASPRPRRGDEGHGRAPGEPAAGRGGRRGARRRRPPPGNVAQACPGPAAVVRAGARRSTPGCGRPRRRRRRCRRRGSGGRARPPDRRRGRLALGGADLGGRRRLPWSAPRSAPGAPAARRRGLAAAVLAGAAFQVLYGTRGWFARSDEIWGVAVAGSPSRLRGTFVNPNHLALFLEIALALVFAWGWWASRRAGEEVRPERRVLLLALPALAWLTLFAVLAFTGSRAGLGGGARRRGGPGVPLGGAAPALAAGRPAGSPPPSPASE